MTTPSRKTRGAALATAMLLTLLLLTLGMSFLTFSQRDLQFQRRQQATNQAQQLARAGIDYFNYLDNKIPAQTPTAPVTKVVVVGIEEFVIEPGVGGDFISRGRVKDSSGAVVAERAIYVDNPGPGVGGQRSYDMHL